MKLVLKEIGDLAHIVPDESVEAAGPGEALVTIEAATVNPSDLKLAEGKYGFRPPRLPFAIGTEGVGRVTGPADSELLGKRVLLVPTYEHGTWAEQVVVKTANLIELPDEGDPVQLATVGVNPLTAYLALKQVDLKPGDWVGQNLGNSAVGRAAAQLARHAGFRMLSVVRRPEAAVGLESDVVLVDGPDLAERIKAELGDSQLRLVLDGTGDATVGALATAAEFGATLVSYSSVTGQTPPIGLGNLIYRQLRIVGLWIINWTRTAPREELEQVYGELARLTVDGVLHTEVAATYPVAEYTKALEHAGQGGGGKVLFRP